MAFKPKFISFDCYGTLINFEMGPAANRLFKDRVPADRMPGFLDSFRAYRLDEVLGGGIPELRGDARCNSRVGSSHSGGTATDFKL